MLFKCYCSLKTQAAVVEVNDVSSVCRILTHLLVPVCETSRNITALFCFLMNYVTHLHRIYIKAFVCLCTYMLFLFGSCY